MKSSGVYWKPIYYVLEDAFTLLLVNAAHLASPQETDPNVR